MRARLENYRKGKFQGEYNASEELEYVNRAGDKLLKAIHQKDEAGLKFLYASIFLLCFLSLFSYCFYSFGEVARLQDTLPFLKKIILPLLALIIIGIVILHFMSIKPQRAQSSLAEYDFYKKVYGIKLPE